ncbi:MAG: acyltransferase [Bacteroidales bacterium]|jgi:fucose 4-O-acetylase-like acetyltransferase|nr:acyltransferase [Bacteroidales bacterium]
MNDPVSTKRQIDWLAILRGWVVLLVVVVHSPTSYFGPLEKPFEIFNDFFIFRMPLFFFISGFLLYYTKIRKNGDFSSIVKERFPRILIPYIFITLSVFAVKLVAELFMNIENPVDVSFTGIINMFIYPDNNPWSSLWFLHVIFIFFLCYPILKFTLRKTYTAVLTFALLVLLHYFFPEEVGFLGLSKIFKYFVFFYFGLLFSRFELHQYVKRIDVVILSILLIIGINFIRCDNYETIKYLLFPYSIAGITLSIFFAKLCEKTTPNLFSSFRKYYYQIYILGEFFQRGLLVVYKKYQTDDFSLLLLGFIPLSILLGIYGPVIVCKIAEKLNWKPLMKILGF